MSQTHVGLDGPPYAVVPRWVKVFGIISLVLLLLFGIMMLTNPGNHGPRRHIPSGEPAGHSPVEHRVQQP